LPRFTPTLVYSVPAADPDWECRASGGKGGSGVVLAGIEFASGLRHSAWESHDVAQPRSRYSISAKPPCTIT
jgi:hypothetical protein